MTFEIELENENEIQKAFGNSRETQSVEFVRPVTKLKPKEIPSVQLNAKSKAKTEVPKSIEKLIFLFPVGQALLVFWSLWIFFSSHPLIGGMALMTSIYLLPVLLWRLFLLRFSMREGVSYIGTKEKFGNPWIVAHYLQYFFISFPAFENVLILVPGAFSHWLRLWGSKVGKGVLWNPGVQIVDRTHLEVGDYAFFGDKVYLSTHIIKRKNGRIQLLVRGIKIGQKTLLGYQSVIGPGSIIPDNYVLPSLSRALLGRIAGSVYDLKTEQ